MVFSAPTICQTRPYLLIWCDLGAVGGTGMALDLSANATLAVHVLVAVVERFALSATASVTLAVLHFPGLLRILGISCWPCLGTSLRQLPVDCTLVRTSSSTSWFSLSTLVTSALSFSLQLNSCIAVSFEAANFASFDRDFFTFVTCFSHLSLSVVAFLLLVFFGFAFYGNSFFFFTCILFPFLSLTSFFLWFWFCVLHRLFCDFSVLFPLKLQSLLCGLSLSWLVKESPLFRLLQSCCKFSYFPLYFFFCPYVWIKDTCYACNVYWCPKKIIMNKNMHICKLRDTFLLHTRVMTWQTYTYCGLYGLNFYENRSVSCPWEEL